MLNLTFESNFKLLTVKSPSPKIAPLLRVVLISSTMVCSVLKAVLICLDLVLFFCCLLVKGWCINSGETIIGL